MNMEHLPVIVVIKYRRLIQEGKYMRINLYRTLSMFFLILILIAQVMAKPKSQPLYYSELSRIVNRTDLSVSQKIALTSRSKRPPPSSATNSPSLPSVLSWRETL